MFSWNVVWLGVAVAKLRLPSRGINLLQGRNPEKKKRKKTAQVYQLFTFNLKKQTKKNCTLAKHHNYLWVSSQNAGRQSSGLHVLFLLTARWHMRRNEYPALQKAQHQFSLTTDCNKTLCQHLQKMAV